MRKVEVASIDGEGLSLLPFFSRKNHFHSDSSVARDNSLAGAGALITWHNCVISDW